MQPLIKFRLLASQLDQTELRTLFQSILRTFGEEKIVSFIFNHFLAKYNQKKRHNDDLANVINMISSILDSREENKSDEKDVNADQTQISIDSLPSDLIGECASYLQQNDYLSLSKSNRKVYIGCNSPSTLQELIFDERHFAKNLHLEHCDLRHLKSIKRLRISTALFNKYTVLYPQHKLFPKLNYLFVDHQADRNNEGIRHIMNTQCINFAQIQYLHCSWFKLSDFNLFCSFLCSFSNISKLGLYGIQLTEFNDLNRANAYEISSELFPELTAITIETTHSSLDFLRNKLLTVYSKQLESLHYNERNTNISVTSFPKLKELWITNGSINTATRIINSAQSLELFYFDTESHAVLNENEMRKLIDTLFMKQRNLVDLQFNGNYRNIQKIMQLIEFALFNAMDVFQSVMTLVFNINRNFPDQAMDEFSLCVCRIINALDLSMIYDFMVGVHVCNSNAKVFDVSIVKFKQKHLVHVYNQSRSIIISNKNCKINGYRKTWRKLMMI